MARKRKSIKSKVRKYAVYGAWGQLLFGQPFNNVTKVRMFFDTLDFLDDDDE